MSLPFREKKISDSTWLRLFRPSLNESELQWHTDGEDRVVKLRKGEGWSLQTDNELPVQMQEGTAYFIPAHAWHRILPGSGPALIEVKKLDSVISEKKNSNHPRQYKAPEGSKRDKKLDRAKELLDRARKEKDKGKAEKLRQRAYKIRDRMEKKERKKPSFKTRKSKYTPKKEVADVELNKLLEGILNERSQKISKAVRTSLKKKAKKHNMPLGALTSVFRKGLGAYYSSGSRPGMTPHQWAHARVNSFIRGGPARKVDKTEWKKVQKHRKKKKK